MDWRRQASDKLLARGVLGRDVALSWPKGRRAGQWVGQSACRYMLDALRSGTVGLGSVQFEQAAQDGADGRPIVLMAVLRSQVGARLTATRSGAVTASVSPLAATRPLARAGSAGDRRGAGGALALTVQLSSGLPGCPGRSAPTTSVGMEIRMRCLCPAGLPPSQ